MMSQLRKLLDNIITLAIKNYKKKIKKTFSFDTNILQNAKLGNGTKGVKNRI
jgi:hypothetical protein